MPFVTCPTCGERGKIPANLVGARIKCRMCGESFLVAPPAGKAADGAGRGGELTSGHAPAGPSAVVEVHGIEVEGLDASAWSVPTETAAAVAVVPADPESSATGAGAVAEAGPGPTLSAREYKLLTSRDKVFDGKFELGKLEEVLNHLARQGWAARSMATPHLKNFTGVLEEVVVVMLEREGPAS